MRYLRGLLCMTSIAGVILALGLAGLGADPQSPAASSAAPLPAPRHHREYHAIGTNSCAATACHGSLRPDVRASAPGSKFIRRDEYIVWFDNDPHARSLLTLEGERSQAMLLKLGIKDETDPRYANCRACHALEINNPATNAITYDAVSCEACHGPASEWGSTHYEKGWNPLAETGFADTKDVRGRANTCVKCHVGDHDREVNHDLIAAGHPALKFEFSAYYNQLPKHWNDDAKRKSDPQFELTLWQAGQIESAEAAINLLSERINRAAKTKPEPKHIKPVWPEFAEYDCFACHHNLEEGSWYRPRKKSPDQLAVWNPWYLWSSEYDDEYLGFLRDTMQKKWDADPNALKGAAANRAPMPLTKPPETWDAAVQQYLYLSALHRDRQPNAEIKQQLHEVRTLLAFGQGLDSPNSSNADARRKQVQSLLKKLQDKLRSE